MRIAPLGFCEPQLIVGEWLVEEVWMNTADQNTDHTDEMQRLAYAYWESAAVR
jgi:hypothetical protein